MNYPTLDCIEAVNFKLSSEVLGKAMASLRELFWLAPSDGIVKLRIEKASKGFWGSLQINAIQRNFCSSAGAETEQGLMQELRIQIERQLIHWKQERKFCA